MGLFDKGEVVNLTGFTGELKHLRSEALEKQLVDQEKVLREAIALTQTRGKSRSVLTQLFKEKKLSAPNRKSKKAWNTILGILKQY